MKPPVLYSASTLRPEDSLTRNENTKQRNSQTQKLTLKIFSYTLESTRRCHLYDSIIVVWYFNKAVHKFLSTLKTFSDVFRKSGGQQCSVIIHTFIPPFTPRNFTSASIDPLTSQYKSAIFRPFNHLRYSVPQALLSSTSYSCTLPVGRIFPPASTTCSNHFEVLRPTPPFTSFPTRVPCLHLDYHRY